MDNSDDESNVNNENVEIVEIDADTNPTGEYLLIKNFLFKSNNKK